MACFDRVGSLEEGKDADRTVVQDDAFVKSGWGKANPNIDWVDSSKKKV